MTELRIQFGQHDAQRLSAGRLSVALRLANDNAEREQELFERCAARETADDED